MAASKGHKKVVELLLSEGARINEPAQVRNRQYQDLVMNFVQWQNTALHFAVMCDHAEVVGLLLDKGAAITEDFEVCPTVGKLFMFDSSLFQTKKPYEKIKSNDVRKEFEQRGYPLPPTESTEPHTPTKSTELSHERVEASKLFVCYLSILRNI